MSPVLYLRVRHALRNLSILTLFMLLAACSGGSSSAGAGGSGQGSLAIQLTDAPTAAVSEVNVHIVGLKIKPSGSPVQTLDFPGQTVDLLSLQNATELMVKAQVPAGHYDLVQIELDQNGSSVLENNQTKPLQIPSGEIKVLGGFDVAVDGTTTVLLDFKAGASLIQAGNGGWLLKPVILQAKVTKS
ncbi:MAG: DUF4382 domain-containing protein [Arenicellales bacterium]